jgi:hypothetical protein
MEHGKENIYILNRKGFIKYALQHGYVEMMDRSCRAWLWLADPSIIYIFTHPCEQVHAGPRVLVWGGGQLPHHDLVRVCLPSIDPSIDCCSLGLNPFPDPPPPILTGVVRGGCGC